MDKKKIIICDEQPLILDALSRSLTATERYEVVAVTSDSDRAFYEILEHQPDLVIMDLELPGRGAIDVVDQISARQPAIQAAFLTAYDTNVFIDVALRLGVTGYLLKTESVSWIIQAIDRICSGETVYSQAVADRLYYDRESKRHFVKTQNFFSNLTLRQIQVLRHLARGESVKEVARIMMLSERAIESHKYRIMQKIGIHDRVVLTRFAIREGLMPA